MQHSSEGETTEKLVDLASDQPMLFEPAHAWFVERGAESLPVLIGGLEDEFLGSVGHARILRLLQHFAEAGTLPAVLGALQRALRRRDPLVRSAAMEALVAFRSPAVAETLVDLLQEANTDIVKHAAALLGEVGGEEAVGSLAHLLQNDDAGVRYSAVRGLLRMEEPAARETLQRHLPQERDAEIRTLITSELN